MKKFIGIAATVLAAGLAATLAGCSGCAGCSGDTKNTALTSSNWFTGTSYKGIQPSFIVDEAHPEYTKEIITYEVTHDSSSAVNTSYSVEYKDGAFRTEFYATSYDWNGEGIPEAFKDPGLKTEILYVYKTELNISVRFTLKSGESSEWFDDSVVTECYFRTAGNNLQPVYSKQTIKSTTPANYQASSLSSAYVKVDAEYENFYNHACDRIISYATENGEKTTETYNLSKAKNSVFDNSSLYVAVRSLKLSDSLSQTISLFSAASGGVSDYLVSGTNTALGADELSSISAELQENGLYVPNGDAEGISTVAVDINYGGGALQGTTQTVWYAAIENADNNTGRATMLKLSVPLSYNLGTLNYTLKEIESTLWNG